MIAGKLRAPIREHLLEATLRHMRLRQALRYVGQPKSAERRIQHLRRGIKRELTFDADLEFAAGFFEFPGVKPAERRQPQIDAVMIDQILRALGFGAFAEIGGRANHGHAHVGRCGPRSCLSPPVHRCERLRRSVP